MDLAEDISEALGELEDVMPAGEFTWHEGVYKCWPGSARREKKLGAGGFQPNSDLRMLVRLDQFTAETGIPKLKQIFVYLGNIYRIDAVEQLPGGKLLRLEGNDPSSGV